MRAALVVAALAGSATAAAAQRAPASEPAFSVERFTPAPGSALWIGVEDADVPAAGRWVVTGSTWIASRPIVLRALSTGAESTEPVRLRWGQEVAVARGLGARYLVGLAVPAALQWGDRLAGIGLSEAPLARAVLGDLRLHGRARVVGAPGAPGLAAAVAVALTVPTGDDGDFAGEAGAVLAWGLRAGYRTGDVAITGGAGLRLRTEEVVLLSPARPHGNELTASLGAAVRLAPLGRQFGGGDRAWAMVEVEAALGDDAGKGARGPSPAEARIGVRADVAHCWSVALAGGGGFTRDEVGSPGYRLIAQLTFHQDPIHDRDGDGVRDGQDACWTEREDRDGHDDWDGCPELDDDGDGVEDRFDRCPRQPEDRDGYRDADGCPDAETVTTDRGD
ncbi:MAG: thrombospondin type 3 repeat-containing protein [Myxococcales bacterium]|nr:thrombospondin type 3 repeat-containing protein [Myxococcales bacterium]MBK7195651.1 thrombospondin type 3 repeat-containing protein [Myxococcales bacterium]MBP6844238.1 thrombospondin type 3 repeat-containing protein [Kofleriaceae bacterium]